MYCINGRMLGPDTTKTNKQNSPTGRYYLLIKNIRSFITLCEKYNINITFYGTPHRVYRIGLNETPPFYFSSRVFGWGSIKKDSII